MVTITLPCGKGHCSAELEEKNLLGIYTSALPDAAADPCGEVRRALSAPIGAPALAELARGKKNAVVITSDHTRPVPSKIIMPEILAELRRGNPGIDITILVATGFHRATTHAELAAKLGPEIAQREKIVVHDSRNRNTLIRIGTLPSGGELIVNRLAVETELLVGEGFIEPHFFAGFSGGRKSILPGIASKETVFANHCAEFIQSPFARTGNLEHNPIHEDMVYAAKAAGLAFIVNVIINPEKKIVKAVAGDPFAAHAAGCGFLRQFCGVSVPECDIAVTSNGGYPLDQNVYQCVKGMTAGEAVCREGGVILLCAGCSDGAGGESFYRHLAAADPAALLADTVRIPRDKTEADQWQYQILARILTRFHVIMVGTECDPELLKAMHLRTAATLQEGLAQAFAITGEAAKVAVLPDGVSVVASKC